MIAIYILLIVCLEGESNVPHSMSVMIAALPHSMSVIIAPQADRKSVV